MASRPTRRLPSSSERLTAIATSCARTPTHTIGAGERKRYVDLVGWCCTQCADQPESPLPPPSASATAVRALDAPTQGPGQARTLAITLAVVALVAAVFLATRWVQSSADSKFDEVGKPVGAGQENDGGTPVDGSAAGTSTPPPGASELNPMRISAENIQPWPLSIESTLLACHQLPEADQVASGRPSPASRSRPTTAPPTP